MDSQSVSESYTRVLRRVGQAALAALALMPMQASAALTLWMTTTTNHLLALYSFNGDPHIDRTITGLAAGEVMAGIDFRPATGELYGMAKSVNGFRFVKLDVVTGAATIINQNPITIAGTSFGFSFEASSDRIRVVSDADVNVRINPATGQISNTDTSLAYVTGDPHFGTSPNVVHLAHGRYESYVYGIDLGTNKLVKLGSSTFPATPANGQLTTVGSLNLTFTPADKLGGFDIDRGSGTAYVVLHYPSAGAPVALFEIDLQTGALKGSGSSVQTGGAIIDGLAIAQINDCADLDGNGKVDALTDGLIYLRALFGLTGTSVTTGALGPGASRSTWAAIRSYMNNECGMTWAP